MGSWDDGAPVGIDRAHHGARTNRATDEDLPNGRKRRGDRDRAEKSTDGTEQETVRNGPPLRADSWNPSRSVTGRSQDKTPSFASPDALGLPFRETSYGYSVRIFVSRTVCISVSGGR